MVLEDVADVNRHPVVDIYRSSVEELPIPVVVMDDEQDRQLAAMNRTAQVGGIRPLAGHGGDDDSVKEKLNVEDDRPDGMIIHTAGFTAEGVFRIFDVWETEEQHARFMTERLRPVVEEVMSAEAVRPSESSYELHDVVTA